MNSPDRRELTVLALFPNHDEETALRDWRARHLLIASGSWLPVPPCLPLVQLGTMPDRQLLQELAEKIRQNFETISGRLSFGPVSVSDKALPGWESLHVDISQGREALASACVTILGGDVLALGCLLALIEPAKDAAEVPASFDAPLSFSTAAIAPMHLTKSYRSGGWECCWERGKLVWLPRKAKR